MTSYRLSIVTYAHSTHRLATIGLREYGESVALLVARWPTINQRSEGCGFEAY